MLEKSKIHKFTYTKEELAFFYNLVNNVPPIKGGSVGNVKFCALFPKFIAANFLRSYDVIYPNIGAIDRRNIKDTLKKAGGRLDTNGCGIHYFDAPKGDFNPVVITDVNKFLNVIKIFKEPVISIFDDENFIEISDSTSNSSVKLNLASDKISIVPLLKDQKIPHEQLETFDLNLQFELTYNEWTDIFSVCRQLGHDTLKFIFGENGIHILGVNNVDDDISLAKDPYEFFLDYDRIKGGDFSYFKENNKLLSVTIQTLKLYDGSAHRFGYEFKFVSRSNGNRFLSISSAEIDLWYAIGYFVQDEPDDLKFKNLYKK